VRILAFAASLRSRFAEPQAGRARSAARLAAATTPRWGIRLPEAV